VQQHAAVSRGAGSEQGGRQHASKEERGGGPVCEQEEPMVGGTDEELPTRRDRCATRRSCTCTSDEADICYSAADSGASAPWPPGRWRRGVGRRRRGVGGGGRRADARGPGQGLGKIREVIEGERRRKDGGGR